MRGLRLSNYDPDSKWDAYWSAAMSVIDDVINNIGESFMEDTQTIGKYVSQMCPPNALLCRAGAGTTAAIGLSYDRCGEDIESGLMMVSGAMNLGDALVGYSMIAGGLGSAVLLPLAIASPRSVLRSLSLPGKTKGLATLTSASALAATSQACTTKMWGQIQPPDYDVCLDTAGFGFVEGRTAFAEVEAALKEAGVTNLSGHVSLVATETSVYGALIGSCTRIYLFEDGILSKQAEIPAVYIFDPKLHAARILDKDTRRQALFIVYSDLLSFGQERGFITITHPGMEIRYQSLEDIAAHHGGLKDILFVGRSIGPRFAGENGDRLESDFTTFTARDGEGQPWDGVYKMYWRPETGELEFIEMDSEETKRLESCSCYVEWLYR